MSAAVNSVFPRLFEPLRIRGCTLKNRIMSTGHDTKPRAIPIMC